MAAFDETTEELADLQIREIFVHDYIVIRPMPQPPSSKSTKKRHPKISFKNRVYCFHLEQKKTGVTVWRCREGNCGSIVRTYGDKASEPKTHTCQAKYAIEIDAMILHEELLERCQREGENPAPKIYGEELAQFG